ncbi:hypothetical protein BH09PSE2_BH09PSE2_16980 [soil metagenome]
MGRSIRSGLALVCALVVQVAATQAKADCDLRRWAELPVALRALQPLVSAKIDGHEAQLLLDTGAWASTLSPKSVGRYGLKLGAAPPNLRVFGVGGSLEVNVATVKVFTLGATPIEDVDFLVGGGEPRGGYAGLLGQNILHIADEEFDFQAGVIRLFKPKGCERANLAYWAGDKAVSVLELEPQNPHSPFVIATGRVNGVRMRVMFDTGATTSVMTLEAAARAGIRTDGPGVVAAGYAGGLDGRALQTWIAPVDSFELGGEQVKRTKMRIGGGGVAGVEAPDMLLGADFFRSHHVLISNSQHRVYFTYAGGPVFDLSTGAQAPTAPAP